MNTVTENTAGVYAAQGFGHALGMGDRPALLVIDFTIGFCDPRHFGSDAILAAARATVPLLERFRSLGLPVAHTRIVYADDGSDAGVFAAKVPTLLALTETSEIGQFAPFLAPRPGELVIRKQQASAFAGTQLASWLVARRIDTLVVAGCTTSGCVRASVVDAASQNFRPLVARECVGDRAPGPHEASLFDMEQKYADVMPRDAIMRLVAERTA